MGLQVDIFMVSFFVSTPVIGSKDKLCLHLHQGWGVAGVGGGTVL